MSRRSHKNFRKCGGLRIIGQGELSEFDASANAGLFVSAPRWPLLASAPATVVNGQRFRLAEAGREFGREYAGRSVVELNSLYQQISLTQPPVQPKNNQSIRFLLRDVVAGVSGVGDLVNCFDHNNTLVWWSYNDGNAFYFLAKDSLGVDHLLGDFSIPAISNGSFNLVEYSFCNETAYLNVNGINYITADITAFTFNDVERIDIKGNNTGLLPLQVCDIKQYLNGILIDNIPCTETTGTTLANTVTPSRPATLSDANAHALAWVPQDVVSMSAWLSNGIEWVVLT